jgi:hypothetical protein
MMVHTSAISYSQKGTWYIGGVAGLWLKYAGANEWYKVDFYYMGIWSGSRNFPEE